MTADNILTCSVEESGDSFKFAALCDAASDGHVQVSSSGHTITPKKQAVSKGTGKSVLWDAIVTPPPEAGTVFTFKLRASQKDTIL